MLITGASGEIGHGLITRIAANGSQAIITLDVRPLEPDRGRRVHREVIGSITDNAVLDRILAEFDIDHVYHLAAYLSTRSEFTPVTAHHVNVEGTLNLLEFAQKQGESHGRTVVFLYPSSIAAYGIPDPETKARAARVTGGRVQSPDDDVRVQQAVLRAAGRLLRPPLQAAGGRAAAAGRSTSAPSGSRA